MHFDIFSGKFLIWFKKGKFGKSIPAKVWSNLNKSCTARSFHGPPFDVTQCINLEVQTRSVTKRRTLSNSNVVKRQVIRDFYT